ncbi:hypothetical protein [Maribacter algarum]|uniref:hypothetical protein n=1 Tax=Maribacter algarum (ex Zhang et al. 2020) TaxID=2578118 RepID=UPI001486F86D|nr:hypothetical protein [Maribacter algarum]
MKKVMLAIMALVLNMSLFSCTTDSIAETDTLYETQSTEGDDGDVDPDPDA